MRAGTPGCTVYVLGSSLCTWSSRCEESLRHPPREPGSRDSLSPQQRARLPHPVVKVSHESRMPAHRGYRALRRAESSAVHCPRGRQLRGLRAAPRGLRSGRHQLDQEVLQLSLARPMPEEPRGGRRAWGCNTY